MEATEYLIKLTKLLKKIGEGYYVVSNDPDCDCDFGVDIDGNLIICGERSILKLCELETMKYRYHYDYEQDEADYHLHFIFLNNIDLYLYGNPSEGFYNEKHLIYKGRSMYNTGVNDILYASSQYGWNGVDDFIIDNDGVLYRYFGDEKRILIPEGIKKIGKYVFSDYKILESVVLPESLTEIGKSAFSNTPIRELNLKNVHIIRADAFSNTELESITLPKTLIQIEEDAFFNCKQVLLDHIKNESSVDVSEGIFVAREDTCSRSNKSIIN